MLRGTQRSIRDIKGKRHASEIDTRSVQTRISEHELPDGLTVLFSAYDYRLGRLEKRSREGDVVQLWLVGAMDMMPFKVVAQVAMGQSQDWSQVGREWE